MAEVGVAERRARQHRLIVPHAQGRCSKSRETGNRLPVSFILPRKRRQAPKKAGVRRSCGQMLLGALENTHGLSKCQSQQAVSRV